MSTSSKPKILFVKPPYKRLKGLYDHPYIPLGLAYLSSFMRKKGYETLIYNGDVSYRVNIIDEAKHYYNRHKYYIRLGEILLYKEHEALEEFRKLLFEYNPDIIGISVLSNETGAAMLISEICKDFSHQIPVIWGGVHPTFMPESILKNCPYVDYLVLGEGEHAFHNLCRLISGGNEEKETLLDLEGIAYRDGDNKIVINKPGRQVENLDNLPYPDFENLAFKERYDGIFMGNIIASRGCPYRCAFCSSRSFWGKKIRYRSIDNIIGEINYRIDYMGINHFTFVDDSFTIREESISDLCEGIIKNKIPFFWGTMTRADLIDESIVKLMRKAKCIHLHFGIETGSEETSRIIKKDLDLELARRSIEMVQKNNIPVGTFFIIGFPDETRSQIIETYEYIRSIKPARIGFNVFEPQPGALLYDYLIEKGIIPPDVSWENFPMFPDGHYLINMSPDEFRDLADMVGSYVFAYNMKFSTKLKNYKSNFIRRLRYDPKFYFKKLKWFIKKRYDDYFRRS